MRRTLSESQNGTAPAQTGFTLTELLIVIGIIVLMIGLAVPVLGILTGNRSVDAAQNIIQSMLNDARMQAIGQQRDTGVLFFVSPVTARVSMVMVQASDAQSIDGQLNLTNPPDVYLDLVPDRDEVPLTPGVMAQVIDNCSVNAGNQRLDDAYIGYTADLPLSNPPITRTNFRNWHAPDLLNPQVSPPGQTLLYGGVILFDSRGHLVSRTYGFRLANPDPNNLNSNTWIPTEMGSFLYYNTDTLTLARRGVGDGNGHYTPGLQGAAGFPPESKFGIVLFNQEQFLSRGFALNDAQRRGGGAPSNGSLAGTYNANWRGTNVSESAEETWIDQNSVPLLVNRYTGALVKGE